MCFSRGLPSPLILQSSRHVPSQKLLSPSSMSCSTSLLGHSSRDCVPGDDKMSLFPMILLACMVTIEMLASLLLSYRSGYTHTDVQHSYQPLNSTPSASAQSAASHAFLKHQASTNSLSSAAAAAALRSHTPTPTSVENVQTKRMLQRQSSTSSRASTGSFSRGGLQPGLHRSSSSGSMTTRTFRDQSPRRPRSSSGGESFAPPIPDRKSVV